jgi:hypothetical protein
MYEQFEAGDTANRFRSSADWFVSTVLGGIVTVRVGATGERAVDLVHALAAHLPEEIRVSVEYLRDKQAWTSERVSRTDARDVLARLKLLLSSYGGVEFVLYTADDQLTLTPELDVVIYSRGKSWLRHLWRMGLEARDTLPPAAWRPNRHAMMPAAELREAIDNAVRRLGLAETLPDAVGP